jgi:hypothetical protein
MKLIEVLEGINSCVETKTAEAVKVLTDAFEGWPNEPKFYHTPGHAHVLFTVGVKLFRLSWRINYGFNLYEGFNVSINLMFETDLNGHDEAIRRIMTRLARTQHWPKDLTGPTPEHILSRSQVWFDPKGAFISNFN